MGCRLRHCIKRNKICNDCEYYYIEDVRAEWRMVLDDFDDGNGERVYPHCSNCHQGVYRHDAGSWCPFCGAAMKNPMRW